MGSFRQPALFIGHGSPMNAISDNRWSRGFRALGAGLPRPRAILSVSAHWFVPGTHLTAEERPRTIHDFGGFPDALYRVRYPAPGDPGLAHRAAELLGNGASPHAGWGLDHGTWSVLRHLFPAADIPVVQLSLDRGLDPEGHLVLARSLAPLRDEGVLIMGSGNAVHNLRHAMSAGSARPELVPAWAQRFDEAAADALRRRDLDWFADVLGSEDGRAAHPTPDHYLPLLYVAAVARADDPVHFPLSGFDLGSISMRAALVG